MRRFNAVEMVKGYAMPGNEGGVDYGGLHGNQRLAAFAGFDAGPGVPGVVGRAGPGIPGWVTQAIPALGDCGPYGCSDMGQFGFAITGVAAPLPPAGTVETSTPVTTSRAMLPVSNEALLRARAGNLPAVVEEGVSVVPGGNPCPSGYTYDSVRGVCFKPGMTTMAKLAIGGAGLALLGIILARR